MSATRIEWATHVWNPVTGCTPCSPGCANCYAVRMAKRLAGRCGYPVDDPFRVTPHPERLREPKAWKKPRRVFVCSMGDFFHESLSVEPDIEAIPPDVPFILKCMGVMHDNPRHTFLILTKRPERMLAFCQNFGLMPTEFGWTPSGESWPTNVWAGVTVCNQEEADAKIPLLLQVPAAVRFVSVEPMLGPVSLDCLKSGANDEIDALRGVFRQSDHWNPRYDGVRMDSRLSWVIAGGETGPGARPMHPGWVRSLRDQCQEAAVPFFFKQWGEWQDGSSRNGRNEIIVSDGRHAQDSSGFLPDFREWKSTGWGHLAPAMISRVGKRQAGRLLDGREHNGVPGPEE